MDPITLLGPILERASQLINRLFDVTAARQKARADFLLETLDGLERLLDLHAQAVTTVTAPILKHGDIRQSYDGFYDLANNSAFPRGYSRIRGILHDSRHNGIFKKPKALARLDAVRETLYRFQVSAFMLTSDMKESKWPSFQVAEAFRDAVTLWQRLSVAGGDPAEPSELSALRQRVYSRVAPYAWADRENKLQTPSEVVSYMAVWCKGWQEEVQGGLYGTPNTKGHDLARSVGELKALLRR
jgi:hypothetical protein